MKEMLRRSLSAVQDGRLYEFSLPPPPSYVYRSAAIVSQSGVEDDTEGVKPDSMWRLNGSCVRESSREGGLQGEIVRE